MSKIGGSHVPSIRDLTVGDRRQALPHLKNHLRKMGLLHQICQSFPILKRKMLSTLLSMGYGYSSFSFFLFFFSNVAVMENTNLCRAD